MPHLSAPLLSRLGVCAALTLALAACDGSSSAEPAAPNAIMKSQISGVAATGAPVSGGTVDCKCASGKNASTHTAADGSFSVELADSDLPCALRVAGGTAAGQPLVAPLHSVARTLGTANITPLTEQMLRSLVGNDGAKWFANVTQGDIGAALTEETLAQAFAKLKIFLAVLPDAPSLPVDFHPVTTPFKAEKGDVGDDLLERYGRAFRAADRPSADASSLAEAKGEFTSFQGHAFTVPGWSSFPIRIKKLPGGSEVLIVPDPHIGLKLALITGRDAEGNIATLDRAAPFTAVLSLMGNRIGMLSGRDSHFKHTVSAEDNSSAHYVYLSDEFTEVDYREVLGKSFAAYADSQHVADVAIGLDGKLTDANGASAAPMDLTQWFSPSGWSNGKGENATVTRAKAYRYTANGKTTYAVVAVTAMDRDVPEAMPIEQRVWLAVSR